MTWNGEPPHKGIKPHETDARNEHDAAEADRKTIDGIQHRQSDKETSEPEFRPND